MKLIAPIGIAALMMAVCGPAYGQVQLSPADQADLECMTVMAFVGESDTNAATIGMIYYLGRLEGRAPDVDWPNVFADYLHDMPAERLQVAGARCSQELMVRGEALQVVGERLQLKAKP